MRRTDLFGRLVVLAMLLLALPSTGLSQSVKDAGALQRKANELYDAGKYAQALPLAQRALSIREKALGPNHPDVAGSLNSLALLYQDQGRYADAEPLYKRSLAIYEKAFGHGHRNVAALLNNLAEMYRDQGRYAAAEPLYKRSLAIWEKILGRDHPDIARSLNNLAGLYQAQGRYADAEPLFRRSLALREKSLDPGHPDIAQSLHNLAALYKDQGRYADAEPLYKRSLAIWEKSLGPSHPSVALSLNDLAGMYDDQGRVAEALPLVRTTAAVGFDRKGTHLTVLTDAVTATLIPEMDAFSESYEVVQRAVSSAASKAINQLSVRFAAGTTELAQLIRRDQDLSVENDALNKILTDAVSKEPSGRNPGKEQIIRDRLRSIATERAEIDRSLNEVFPEFAALARPAPTPAKDAQTLLRPDEALVVFDFDTKSYAWVLTETNAEWVSLPIAGNTSSNQVKLLRSSLTFVRDQQFDKQLAFQIYLETFAVIADKLRGITDLSVVTNGALTSLPLQLLVTKDPRDRSLKDVDWLVRSYAITNLPSVASFKIRRSKTATSSSAKPMIAFADPIFSKDQLFQVATSRKSNSRHTQVAELRSLSNFYEDGIPDLITLAKFLSPLPDTANEVRAIADVLKGRQGRPQTRSSRFSDHRETDAA
jgi:tetratricopeptide (TPR) repeat protein